ncbi:mycofactocin biosynthesis peptidyl-dipeptidase MftE [Pseudonocardia sp. CA-107938]|uniref:mycofactocin biosynthesis peptidyl-dipeptidase MftE n=1 Tax=Pseudonocardia sp. CA-107938 TaxID=3240021 RepID=UPI003D8F82F5
MPRHLADTSWTELDGPLTVVIPVGSVEQHGPHLPLDTDVRVAVAVAARGTAGVDGVVVAPPVVFGASGEHDGFPGTLSIGHEALHLVLLELGRSATSWAERVLFVNGHGGNLPTLPNAVLQLRAEDRNAAWFGCGIRGGDAHAGRTETSMMLALDPAAVRTASLAAGNTTPLSELLPILRAGGVRAASPSGVLGDPAGASAGEGEELLEALGGRLRERLRRWATDSSGHLA